MIRVFDLFGEPVPANHGGRGRPAHVPTNENRNRVKFLLARGWNNDRIANALGITPPTLRAHYFSELRDRDKFRDKLDARLGMKLWEQVEAGNVAAIREMQALLERDDLHNYGQARHPSQPADEPAAAQLDKPIGKKEQALIEAHQPNPGTPLGELMMRRQQPRLDS